MPPERFLKRLVDAASACAKQYHNIPIAQRAHPPAVCIKHFHLPHQPLDAQGDDLRLLLRGVLLVVLRLFYEQKFRPILRRLRFFGFMRYVILCHADFTCYVIFHCISFMCYSIFFLIFFSFARYVIFGCFHFTCYSIFCLFHFDCYFAISPGNNASLSRCISIARCFLLIYRIIV